MGCEKFNYSKYEIQEFFYRLFGIIAMISMFIVVIGLFVSLIIGAKSIDWLAYPLFIGIISGLVALMLI